MEEKQHLICINCPLGCRLEVTKTENEGWLIEGNQCNRGKIYAIKEMTNPTRVLTTTVVLENSMHCRLPVRTTDGIPKEKIFPAMEVLNNISVKAPIHAGDIIVHNILGTEVNVIASRSVQ